MKAIITDFDGTLVNTFNANYLAYSKAFNDIDKTLTIEQYKECFGLRFNEFMLKLGIDNELAKIIKENKANYYKQFFNIIDVNSDLVEYIKLEKSHGIKTAIASTAAKNNLLGVLNYHKLTNIFDVIVTGEDVKESKPNPEIYNIVLNKLGVEAKDAIVFEDSEVGIAAAKAAGIEVKVVNKFKL